MKPELEIIHVNRRVARGNVVNIVNERSDDVYRILVSDRRLMGFAAFGKESEEDADAPGAAETLLAEPPDAARFVDQTLETMLGPQALQRRLRKIARDALAVEQEQGVNVLFLALGFLRWFENESSNVERSAPLLLIPVALKRNKRTSKHDLEFREDDILTNLSLQERLKTDFGIALPDVPDSLVPSKYFEDVGAAIGSEARWAVDPDGMQLGFFSFAKMLMLKDLEPADWPEGALDAHGLLNGVVHRGFEAEGPLFDDNANLDDLFEPASLIQVVDADASQTKVIEEVRAGRNLVVQGPPGPGKSQTITNIIAAAVHDGKKVLFVAEKMAALSVVHKRLVETGLRDVCIELHSRSANKKSVLDELARTLSVGRVLPQLPPQPVKLKAVRDDLNACAALLHTPVGETGVTPFEALAAQARLTEHGAPPPDVEIAGLDHMNADEADRMVEAAVRMSKWIEANGAPRDHPFAGVGRLDLQPLDLQRLASGLKPLAQHCRSLTVNLDKVAAFLGLRIEASFRGGASARAVLTSAAECPAGCEMQTLVEVLQSKRLPELKAGLHAGAQWREAWDAATGVFSELAWSIDPGPLRTPLAAGAASFFARMRGAYRNASASLAGVLAGALPKTAAERVALADALLAIRALRRDLTDAESVLKQELGAAWRGEKTDFAGLLALVNWRLRIGARGVKVDPVRFAQVCAKPDVVRKALHAISSLDAILHQIEKLGRALRLDARWFGDADIEDAEIRHVTRRLDALIAEADRYGEWVEFRRCEARLRENGAAPLADQLASRADQGRPIETELRLCRAEAIWRRAIRERPQLAEHAPGRRRGLVEEFQILERKRLKETATLVRAKHLQQLPQGAVGAMGALRGEFGKQRNHMPIRKLLDVAGDAVQRIKPVFMMSPLSVAQFLKPGRLPFDLLIIDEASQVRPEDALGAIARAKQVVVVGDRKQLPPTSFFDRMVADDGPDDDDEAATPTTAKVTELESILTLCEARGVPSRMLEWHYRSRDPSLIAVSNDEFYGSRLVMPPSPLQHDPSCGLSFRRVQGAYDRGGKRSNRIEAEAVVAAVADHASRTPHLSLGVVTFSMTQRDLTGELLEFARRSDQALDAFLREGDAEDFFVKNLENVQGDERDVIFVSVGYGPMLPGQPLSSMNFGPVNADGGARRLNVLFTRAKQRCEVFASFDPGEISVERSKSEGVRVLKRFLDFAQSGMLDEKRPTGAPADSPFEEMVADAIRALGYDVDHQVGSAGFRIDLGVRHPDLPGKYVLAVECDGATYHSALWARERDRLRQQVLEHLGWRFHRIWSTDWFYRRADEMARLKARLEEAKDENLDSNQSAANTGHAESPLTDNVSVSSGDAAEEWSVEPALRAPHYQVVAVRAPTSGEPHEAPMQVLAALVRQIVSGEGPIHQEEVARRFATAFGKERAGRRILDAAIGALRHVEATSGGAFVREGVFWLTGDQKTAPPVRDRSAETGSIAKADMLAPIEIAAAARRTLQDCGAANELDLTIAVARLLGFRRTGPDLRGAIESVIRDMKVRGEIITDGDMDRLPNDVDTGEAP